MTIMANRCISGQSDAILYESLIILIMTEVFVATAFVLAVMLGSLVAFVIAGNVCIFIGNAFKYNKVSEQLSALSWEIAAIGHWAHNEDLTDAEFRGMVKKKTRGREVVAR